MNKDRLISISIPLIFTFITLAVCVLLGQTRAIHAQSPTLTECRVIVALDKSSSIGSANLATLNDNIYRLIDNLDDPSIYMAFWSFSHDGGLSDYNQPRHDYVSTTVDNVGLDEFIDSLPKEEDLEGQTDYAQAYGYSAGNPDINAINSINDITVTPNTAVSSIRSQADVVVLLTDGEPNYPGGLNNNDAAVFAGRKARLQYPDSVTMIGGYISNTPGFVPESLNYTINGSYTDRTRIGPVSFGGQSNPQIYSFVRAAIEDACQIDRSDYWLQPKANITSGDTVREGDTISYSYQVEKDRDEDASRSTGWRLYDVTIDPDVTGNPLDFQSSASACTSTSGEAYCDYVTNCGAILTMLRDRGTCDTVSASDRGSGTATFSGGQNLFYSPDREVTVGDYELGTRICSVLVLDVATASGATNRASTAACVVVGKTPLVQVHGGDIRVGRYFVDDEGKDALQTEGEPKSGVYTSRFKISQNGDVVPNGRTFGSWVEYGVLAPGPIEKIASLSGYAGENGGYDEPITDATCDVNINRLTFANKVTIGDHTAECGYFRPDMGAIPDIVSAMTVKPPINTGSYTSSDAQPLTIDESSPDSSTGIYTTDSDTANFFVGESRLFKSPSSEKGKTYVVYVPNGTVTITGNVTYDNPNEMYQSVNQIPQMVIIAKDINIRENVTEINAWLIATGNNTGGGKLTTCTGFAGAFRSEVCNQLLTINGPVMARELLLWRTKVLTENCRIESIDDCRDAGDPAEIINLPGSSILWTRGYSQNSANARTTSTIELPPYF